MKARETFSSIGNAKKWVIKLGFDHNGYDIGITFDSLLTHVIQLPQSMNVNWIGFDSCARISSVCRIHDIEFSMPCDQNIGYHSTEYTEWNFLEMSCFIGFLPPLEQ